MKKENTTDPINRKVFSVMDAMDIVWEYYKEQKEKRIKWMDKIKKEKWEKEAERDQYYQEYFLDNLQFDIDKKYIYRKLIDAWRNKK